MLMLLIELKGGSSELCDGDVEMSWNVGVGSGSDARGGGSDAWKQWGGCTKTFLLVVLGCNGEWILGGGPA